MTWETEEVYIKAEVGAGWMRDARAQLPRHATRKFAARAPSDVLGICTHHSASDSQDLQAYARYHVGPNHVSAAGAPGILYTWAVDKDGMVYLCNDPSAITWSQGKATGGNEDWSGDENRHLMAVLVMGDFDSEGHHGKSGDPTPQQIRAWRKLTTWLERRYGITGGGHFGHFDFGKAACPGKALRTLVECRRMGCAQLVTDLDWQQALLRWRPDCLPRYGADGQWGNESRAALAAFERAHTHRVDGLRDPFIEILLLRKYPELPEVHSER